MGSADSDAMAQNNERPQHFVFLDGFWIDRTEVTNGQYGQCVSEGECTAPGDTRSYTRSAYYGAVAFRDHPVIWVNWKQAQAYCRWAGRRLPTEAQWEKAARGTDGRIYPWGNAWDASKLNSSDGGVGDTTSVGQYPAGASPYGALDMAGNVWEWVADYSYSAYATSPAPNPTETPVCFGDCETPVARGGSWYLAGQRLARAAYRWSPELQDRYGQFGFRCGPSR
jgi:eukaryotic-like serine/threonine-protein kinase